MKIIIDDKELECKKFVVLDTFGNAVAAGFDNGNVLVFDTCVSADFPKVLSMTGYPAERAPTQVIDAKPFMPQLSVPAQPSDQDLARYHESGYGRPPFTLGSSPF